MKLGKLLLGITIIHSVGMYAMKDEALLIANIASRNWSQAPMSKNEWKSIVDIVVLRANIVEARKKTEEYSTLMKSSKNYILSKNPHIPTNNIFVEYQRFADIILSNYDTDQILIEQIKGAETVFLQTRTLLMNIKNDKYADDEIKKEVDRLWLKLSLPY